MSFVTTGKSPLDSMERDENGVLFSRKPGLLVTRDKGLVTLTLDNPATKNSLDASMWDSLSSTLHEIAETPEDRAVMLTGAGGNFSSGANLSGGLSGSSTAEARPVIEPMRAMGDILLRLQSLPKPTLAKVDGVAVGVGLGLAMACDLIVASDRARFCEIFARRGLALDGGNSWTLPRSVGLRKAKELAYFADMVSADEAERIGLINKVVPVDELDDVAGEWAARLASGPSVALGYSKRMLDASLQSSFADSLESEARAQQGLIFTADLREAMTAFQERRPPEFRGV
jgi:2-(1,2-epoxy-1,2-dihydrophenyl)acetyl-CoA isomerase